MPRFEDMFGNPNNSGLTKKDYANIQRTKFTHKTMQYMQGIEGAIMPIDCRKVLPNETITPNYSIKIKLRNPSVRPLKNGMKFYVHSYVVYNRDLWKNWTKYIGKKGGFNNDSIKYPVMDFWGSLGKTIGSPNDNGTTTRRQDDFQWTSLTPNSLANCLGIPWENYTSKIVHKMNNTPDCTYLTNNRYCFRPTPTYAPNGITTGETFELTSDKQYDVSHDLSETKLLISALPFVAYQKIRRKYYMNYNLYGDNKKGWYEGANGNDDFRIEKGLDQQGYTFVNVISMGQGDEETDHGDWFSTAKVTPGRVTHNFNKIISHVRSMDADHNNEFINSGFDENITEVPGTSGETRRKDVCYLNSLGFREVKGDYFTSGSPYPMLMRDGVQPIAEKEITTDLGDLIGATTHDTTTTDLYEGIGFGGASGEMEKLYNVSRKITGPGNTYTKLTDAQKKALNDALTTSVGINMHDIRTMATLTRFKERMAKINEMDYYNDIIETSFGINPHSEIHEPIYIGGFNGTLGTYAQQSTNTNFNTDTPLGEVGMAETVLQGNCGTFTAKDHGYLITVISCQIDTIYPRHLNRHFTTIDVENEYFPDFNALEPQATLNKEKSLAIDPTNWDDPYNYQDRYLEYKTTLSNLCGLGQSKKQKWDNYQYLTMTDAWEKSSFSLKNTVLHPDYINNECLTVTNEPMFDYDVLREVTSIAPLPYEAKPMEL